MQSGARAIPAPTARRYPSPGQNGVPNEPVFGSLGWIGLGQGSQNRSATLNARPISSNAAILITRLLRILRLISHNQMRIGEGFQSRKISRTRREAN